MKKIYTLLLGALIAMPSFAQEEDVTHLITNPGFDEDLTFNIDGTTKEIVEKGSLSGRSHKHAAADGTIYARSKNKEEGNGSWKRNDTDYSFNGFLGQIKGWELATGSNGEWTYFGAVPYSLAPGSTTVGIADDNNGSWLTVAGKPESDNGDDNLGTMYLRAGWTNSATYSQVVKLPCAQYRLEYEINNMNFAATDPSGLENLCQIKCRKDVFKDEEGVNADGWEKHTIEFTPTAEFTIQLGFKSGNYGSGKNPILLIDGLKLYKIGEADREELLSADLLDFVEQAYAIAEEKFADYSAILEDVNLKIGSFEDLVSEGDLDAMEQGVKDIQVYIASLDEIEANINKFNELLNQATQELETTEYPGLADFQNAIDEADEYASTFQSPDDEISSSDYVPVAIEKLEKAITDYHFSQEATPENPADFTFFIDQPKFGSVVDGVATGNQGSWYIGQSGGDQRLHTGLTDNEGNTITAWNAWRNNLEVGNSVSINQDLTGLKNGKYTVSADLCTQDGCITDQHVYAKGSANSADSPIMTMTGWDPYVWETLTTATVIVVDGKLTIGAIGNGDGQLPTDFGGTIEDKRRGWFCVTNFKLNYLGEASAEEIAAAIAEKFAAAEKYASEMHLAADKAAAIEAIAAAKAEQDLDSLNSALKIAEASEAEYAGVIAGSLKNLQDKIAGADPEDENPYSDNAKAIAQVPVNYVVNYLGSAAATYKETPALTEILRYYRDNLIPAVMKAEAAAETAGEKGKEVINSTIAAVKQELRNFTNDTQVLGEWVEQLNKAIDVAKIADAEIVAGADLSVYMTNPTCDNVNGWTVYKVVGDGSGVKTGQQYDGNSAGGYIDTYDNVAETGKILQATVYQVLNVPNGKYTVSNMMRSTSTGAYLFASDKAPVEADDKSQTIDPAANTVLAEAIAKATNNAKYGLVPTDAEGNPTGEVETVYTDSYGEIFDAAATRVINVMGLGSVMEGQTIRDLAIDKNGGEETCPAAVDELDWNIISANDGKGRGWFNNSLEIEVKDHVLVVGVTCDYAFLGKGEDAAYKGAWFSADNFKIVLNEVGDNTGWDNPATGVDAVETANAAIAAVYNVSGANVNGLQKGINIVKMTNGKVVKVLVK